MSEMIERVARAIAEAHAGFNQNPDPIRYSDKFWQAHESEARAAIAAMRDHMEGKHGHSSRHFHEAFLIECDAALKMENRSDAPGKPVT